MGKGTAELYVCESRSLCPTLCDPHGLYSPWNSPWQNIGVGSLSLLQGIFPTQGLKPGFPHCRQILYELSHKGSPSILEWVAYPFSCGSSQPRNWTGVSCIAGRFFTSWATREVPREWYRCIEGPFESHMWPSFLGQSTEHPFLNHIKHQPLFLFGSEFVPSTAVRPMQSWL